MNCTGKTCIMQYGSVDPATCSAVSFCPQATPPVKGKDQLKNIREVVATLIAWAASEGLDYGESIKLFNKLYSGCEDEDE